MVDGTLPRVRVEFYGLARLRARQTAFSVEADTVEGVLKVVDAAFPQLGIVVANRVSPLYLVSVNGQRFATELNVAVADGSALLIIGADAGG